MPDFLKEAEELFKTTQALRRDFHSHPELGFQEVRTSAIVARELVELGLETSTGIAETGVVALLEGEQPGPVVLLRFDMDALPIQEETGAAYASENPGVMHACGHDGHTAIGLTVARLLQFHRDELAGTVKLVFQPAEEGQGGAERMIQDGVLKDPVPDCALAVHLWNERPLGWLGVSPGPIMAAAETFRISLQGKGGHGALPHLSVDPVVAAAHITTALQTVVSRNVSPLQAAVISVTMIRGGDAFNVIPHQAELRGTIRTFEADVRKQILERFPQVVEGIAQAMGCKAEIEIKSISPAVVNDNSVTARVQESAMQVLPESRLVIDFRSMVSEDMAFILKQVPGCFVFVGSANTAKGLDAPHHHPRFDFDEHAMTHAAALLAATTADLLRLPPAE